MLVSAGPLLVGLLYDVRYADAGWVVQLLAIGTWFIVLASTNTVALFARGQVHLVAACNGAKVVAMILLIPSGYALFGFPGAVAGLSAADLIRYAISAFLVARAGLSGWGQDLWMSLTMAASAAAGWMTVLYLEGQGTHPAVVCAAAATAVTVLWLPALTWYWLRWSRTA